MQRSLWLHQYSPLTTYQSLIDPIPTHYSRWQDIWALLLATLSIYFCVSASLLYGFYGDSRLILGPSSSRLMKTSSLFVKQIEVTNEYTNTNNNDDDIHLYGFNEKPELSSQINWTTSKFLLVEPYSRKGISLWLNKGSTICLRWEAEASSLNQLEGIVIKGERRLEKLKPRQTTFDEATPINVRETENGGKVAEYMVEEDDRYHIGVLNMNPRNIILTMNINVSAKVYDTTKAKNMCSTRNGSCKLGLFFPTTYCVILSTPKNGDDDDGGLFVDIAFMARVFAYIILLGIFMIIIFAILKCLEAGYGDNENVVASQETETEPLTRVQSNPTTYGTINKFHMEESDGSSSSSEELYDEKLCVICYDEQRNCFFVPCGHCATCYDCAQRIVDGESKVCPVCRRLIHKVRKLYNS